MAETLILAACSPGEVRVGAVRDGVLLDYALWRPGRPDRVGGVEAGRVTAVMPGMAGAFVALAQDHGFLPDSAGAAGLGVGDAVTVRIVRAAQGGKGPRLAVTTDPPGIGPNAVQRLAAMHPGRVLVDDPAVALLLRPLLGGRVSIGPAGDYAVDDGSFADAAAALALPEVALPGGMRATIWPTPALVAIDVDTAAATGGSIGGGMGKQASQMALNRAAIPVLARAIRLRSLSGAILIDLAGLPIRKRAALSDDLRAALATDPAGCRLLRFTALGLAEILRPRTYLPLHELLAGPHAAGLAALRQVAAIARPSALPALRANPAIVAALQADAYALPALAAQWGRTLTLISDPALPPGGWTTEEAAHGR